MLELKNKLMGPSKGRNTWYHSRVPVLELAFLKEKWLSNVQMTIVSPKLPRSCYVKNGTKIMSKNILNSPLISITMVGMMVDWMKK